MKNCGKWKTHQRPDDARFKATWLWPCLGAKAHGGRVAPQGAEELQAAADGADGELSLEYHFLGR